VAFEAHERETSIVVRSRIIGLKGERLIEACDSVGRALEGQQLGAPVGVRRRLPWLQGQSALDAGQRLRVPPLERENETEIVMRFRIILIERERLLEAVQRVLWPIGTLEGYP
jgi:hypothetical protein